MQPVEERKLNFLNNVKLKHGEFYNYEKTIYINAFTDIIIGCPIHGDFKQKPTNHLNGHGCLECGGSKPLTNVIFKEKASLKHHNFYNYDKSEYINWKTKIIINCPIHGEFEQIANTHLNGKGCTECGKNKNKKIKEIELFIKEASLIHNNKYDYTKFIYIKAKKKGIIICPIHGEFEQTPCGHLTGKGCWDCAIEKATKTQEQFINEANLMHNFKYNYDKTIYILSSENILATCPIHGDFIVNAYDHINGAGCNKCVGSKGEKLITNYLTTKGVFFRKNYGFDECRYKRMLTFDFYIYIPSLDLILLIEFDGGQHFFPVSKFGGEEQFIKQIRNDNIKNKYCLSKHNIQLLRIPYYDIKNINKILDDFLSNFGII